MVEYASNFFPKLQIYIAYMLMHVVIFVCNCRMSHVQMALDVRLWMLQHSVFQYAENAGCSVSTDSRKAQMGVHYVNVSNHVK